MKRTDPGGSGGITLMGAGESGGGSGAGAGAGSGSGSGSDPGTSNRLARVGMRLGRYVLTDVLGHGAMATVFRAHDSQLGRTVAVKVMNLAVAMRYDAGERFRREAHAVASLKHPGIVEIHDFAAATDDEPAYIVVELINGPTLRELLERRRGRFLPEVAVLIAAEVADALAVAHAHGVVHRDVKPDNVMLEATGDSARVVMTDFGVAHITGLETMTATGALVGSPAYMSPEQARGHDTGPAADVWAVGVLLYQMATGALPFAGRETLAVIAAIARGTFKKPSQVAAAASPELDQLVLRCLKSEPGERYPGARALADELRKLAQASGLGDEKRVLRRFLDDPDRFEAEVRPLIADAAVERARRHVRRGELARALNEVGRATAYMPNHRAAEAVLRSISARRRWMRGTVTALGAAAVFAGAYFGWPVVARLADRPKPPPAQAPPTVAVAPAEVRPPAPPPAPAPPEAIPTAPAPAPTIAEEPAKPEPRRARRGVARGAMAAKVAPAERPPTSEASKAAAAGGEPAPTEATPPAETAPAPPPDPAPTPAATALAGKVRLRGSQGMCFPSLGDNPTTGSIVVDYNDVKPGKHKVFCALNKGGPRLFVGEIDVLPGRLVDRPIKVVDGKPRF